MLRGKNHGLEGVVYHTCIIISSTTQGPYYSNGPVIRHGFTRIRLGGMEIPVYASSMFSKPEQLFCSSKEIRGRLQIAEVLEVPLKKEL